MKRPLKLTLLCIAGIAAIPASIFAVLLVAYLVALAQWCGNGWDSTTPATRQEVESRIQLARTHSYPAFTNLQYGCMHHWNEDTGVYEGSTRSQDYVPAPDHQYVCYKVLGIMPIDAVYDSDDNVIMLFQSFDH